MSSEEPQPKPPTMEDQVRTALSDIGASVKGLLPEGALFSLLVYTPNEGPTSTEGTKVLWVSNALPSDACNALRVMIDRLESRAPPMSDN